MKCLVTLAFAAALTGCTAPGERVQNRNTDSTFATDAERDAVDQAACERLGAKHGTDSFVQCLIQQKNARSARDAARAAAQANSPLQIPGIPNTAPPQAPMAGLGPNGQSCLGYTVQTQFGPRFYCQ
jgi:hypothetical protein